MKRVLSIFLVVLVAVLPLLSLPVPEEAQAAGPLFVSAPCVVLLEPLTHRILYAKSPHTKRPPASTEKLLTALVVLDCLPLNRYVTISPHAERAAPTEVGLHSGELFLVRDLLKACLIRSANDAAVALAEAAAGTESNFVCLMNKKAKQLGLRNSHFTNATGLPDPRGQYSTSFDMALVMKAAERSGFIRKTLQLKSATIRSRAGRPVVLESRNKLIRYHNPVYGKTGFTRAAKHCFVGEACAGGKRVVVSVLGSHTLWRDLKALVDFAFRTYRARCLENSERILSEKQIVRIQAALRRLGYYTGRVDGQYGPATIAAVKKFQKRMKLSADGAVGKKTLDKLKPYL